MLYNNHKHDVFEGQQKQTHLKNNDIQFGIEDQLGKEIFECHSEAYKTSSISKGKHKVY